MGNQKTFKSKAKQLYENQEFKGAVELFTEEIKTINTDPDLYENRAMSYYHLGDYESCLADMNTAQNLQPNNPFRYSSRAYVKNRIGDFDGAIEDYQKAVHLDPEDAIAYNNLGLALESKGYNGKAKRNFVKADELAVNLKPESDVIKKEVESPVKKNSAIQYALNNITKFKFLKEFLNYLRNGFKLTK
ncbi:MAG: Flp pilus assembly protein TadD [Salibacteraceae bacterium]